MAAKSKSDRSSEIRITRIYEAPVKTVWEAWTDPKQVGQWWGPRGFSLTTHSRDLRPGGSWAYTMHGPDGVDYENKTVYHEVEKYSRLVYDHGGNDERPPLFRVTVVFTELDGKTKMEMSMALPTPEAADEARKFIKRAGGEATWDRLAEYLEKESSGKEKFVINRAFDVPLELMFETWTSPKHLAKWLPPTGFRMEFLKGEVAPGARMFYFMTNDSGIKMYGRIQYLELSKPHRIVYTQQFCDEKENISRHPLAPIWPETMLTTVTLAAEDQNRTRVTVVWEPYGSISHAELEAFIAARTGMTQGWTGSFDKLEMYFSET
ncbi:MAG: SRPBCC family protein [Bdellovibrionales bacterium]